jgi:hypothetical protein
MWLADARKKNSQWVGGMLCQKLVYASGSAASSRERRHSTSIYIFLMASR